MDLDSTTLLKTAHLESYLPKTGGKLVHENPSKRDVDRSSDSYMKELTPQQLEQLTALYQPDFDIFGYDPNTIVWFESIYIAEVLLDISAEYIKMNAFLHGVSRF